VANVKDHTIEKIEEFIKNELLTTSNQRQELFDLLRKSSNMMVSLKSWLISEFGLASGITHYNNFINYNVG
jgi:predicted oxidoreductase (fatty acid repression mutant protein)